VLQAVLQRAVSERGGPLNETGYGKKRAGAAAICIAAVPLLYILFRLAEAFGPIDWSTAIGEACLKILVWVIPSLVLVSVAYRLSPRGGLAELGLWSNPLAGYLFGLVAAVPVLALASHGAERLAEGRLVGEAVFGPLAEEVLFRGLLFRQLYRRARRSPIRAMIVSALAFGFAHLANLDSYSLVHVNQWSPAAALIGEATLGGLVFAWLTYRWDSIWPAIGLHSSLNLSWDLTEADHSPWITTARIASVVLAVAFTWRFATRNDSRG
jgi:membrane protease YdiL (CAAX protease family)